MQKNYSEDCFSYNPNASPQDYIDNSNSIKKKEKTKLVFRKITSEELKKRRISSYDYLIK